jgi:SAM-dependent methyltransferase
MDLREVPTTAHTRHPWEVARAHFFRDLLVERKVLPETRAVLDIGAGDGYVAQILAEVLPPRASLVCVDAHYEDTHLRTLPIETGGSISFTRDAPSGPFDLLLLIDVVEHVSNDELFVRGHLARLRPDGFVLVSVPAWQSLYSAHDVALGHFRRYRPRQLRELLTSVGLAIDSSGGLFHSLLFPRAVTVAGERLRGIHYARPAVALRHDLGDPREWHGVGGWSGGRALTRCVSSVLAADNALSAELARRSFALPGLSAWALARKA